MRMTTLLALLVGATGCAIDSPAEWRIAVGTILINAFHEGSVKFAIEKLEEMRINEEIDDETFEHYRFLLLNGKVDEIQVKEGN